MDRPFVLSPRRSRYGRVLPRLAPVLPVVVAILTLALLAPTARAERPEDEPDFFRLAQRFMSDIELTGPDYEDFLHYGVQVGWTNQLYWREWFISDDEVNLDAQAWVQAIGFRFNITGVWSDPFDHADRWENPYYWGADLSYMTSIRNATILAGVRRNNLTGAPEGLGFPDFIDEVFLKVMGFPETLQAEGSNLIYYVNLHQRISDTDGTLIDLGFQTLNFTMTGQWYLGDVVLLAGHVTWNQRFLQSYGRFSSYKFTARSLKDISNLDNPGRGPWWLTLGVTWVGGIADRVDDQVLFYVGLIFADFLG